MLVLVFLLCISLVSASVVWGHGLKIREKEKFGEFEFLETKDYYYAKIGISVGGVLDTNSIDRSSTKITVVTKDRERVSLTTKARDTPSYYLFSNDSVVVTQRAYVRHVYYTKYNKTYNSGKVVERKKRNYDKGYTDLTYEIDPEGRTILMTLNFNGKEFKLEMEDIQYMKQETQGSRKVWVKY